MMLDYRPTKTKYISQSEVTNTLLKRKRVLEFGPSTAEEWFDLANDFLADDGRANHAYCMTEYRKRGGVIEPQAFTYTEVPEPDVPSWIDRKDM